MNIKRVKTLDLLTNFLNDIASATWRPVTRSQAASDYFHNAHAFANTALWRNIVKEAKLRNINLDEKLIRSDYQNNAIISFNIVPSIFDENTPFILSNEHVRQLNNIDKPKFLLIAENDNVVYTIGTRTNYPIISGNGRAISDTIHKKIIKWFTGHRIPIYYLGDLDPIGLKIAEEAANVIKSKSALALYPSMPTTMGLLMDIGTDAKDLSSKRFATQSLSNSTLINLYLAFELTNFEKFVEQEQLIEYYIAQIERNII